VESIEILPGVKVTNERCLVFDDGPTVVIGDLHLGYESALEGEGMYIPRMNTRSIRDSINRILSKYEPKRFVLLGDIKHDFRRAPNECRAEVMTIMNMIRDACELILVRGNHDNFLQNVLPDTNMEVYENIDLCGFRMEHGHIDSGKRPVVIGHEHPSVRIQGAVGGGVKLQCFVYARESGIIVIPPFSPFSSGNDLMSDHHEAFMSPVCKAADMDSAELYGVSELGILRLGTLSGLEGLEL